MKAVVLAGGKSSRMGQNKALLPLGETTMIQRIINVLGDRFDEINISGNNENYTFLNKKMITDIYPEKGPLGGIFSALEELRDDILICSCDMPLISLEIIDYLMNNHKINQISVICFGDKIYPTLGIYPYSIKDKLEGYILQNQLKMQEVLRDLNANIIPLSDNFNRDTLLNINTKENYEMLKKKYF